MDYLLRDDQWNRISHLLPGKAGDCGVTAKDNRRFVEAVLWIAKTGAPWRSLPKEFGDWHRVYVRYSLWAERGVWSKIMGYLSQDGDLEYLMVDGTIVRVHQHGASKKDREAESMGVSRGELSTKIHAATDSHGNPVRVPLSPGNASEYKKASALIAGFTPVAVLANKGYDSAEFVNQIEMSGACAVIPSRKNRKQARELDKHLYKDRHLVEKFFLKIKQFRRIAIKYESRAKNYLSLLCLVSVTVGLI